MRSTATRLVLAAAFSLSGVTKAQVSHVERAWKKGEVVLNSTITVGAFNELNKAIKENYPLLNVRHIRLAPAQQLARIRQEQRAERFRRRQS